jgi:voltage-gated potassium channel Kch
VRAAALLAPASEFAFVLFPLAARYGLMNADTANSLAAIGALSMMLGPPLTSLVELLLRQRKAVPAEPEADSFEDVQGTALVLGFGRFSHIATQLLVAQNVETTLIDNNANRIRAAAKFGFKVYYGDATRLDVLRAARADQARVILVCVDDPAASLKIVDLLQHNFPLARLLVRAYDRAHAVELMKRGVEQPARELFESSLAFGRHALEALGVDPEAARATEEEVRRLGIERLERQRAEHLDVGPDLRHQKVMRPEPLVEPSHPVEPLNQATADVVGETSAPKPGAAVQWTI